MNPLLAKVKLPGRVFTLPSKGLFYKGKGILASSSEGGDIQVKPMSALAEMKLRSADLLFTGKILKELCDECVPEVLIPDQLLSQDVDALFAFLRVVTYGPKLKVFSRHFQCEKPTEKPGEYEVDLEALMSKPNNKLLDHFETVYQVQLSNGQIVHTKPNSYGDALKVVYIRQEINRLEAAGDKVDSKLVEKAAIQDMLAVIASVEDDGEKVDDREMIDEWLRAVTKPILNELMAGISKTSKWGYDFNVKLKCTGCASEYEHALDLDPVSFFFG